MKKRNIKALYLHRLTISHLSRIVKGGSVRTEADTLTKGGTEVTQADTQCVSCAATGCANETEFSCKAGCWYGDAQ